MKKKRALHVPPDLRVAIEAYVRDGTNQAGRIDHLRDILHELSPTRSQPVDRVRWVPLDQVEPNDYNPNHVAETEMALLLRSVLADGYTQPIVTIYDPDKARYVIVDGFHRHRIMTVNADVRERCGGLVPIVVIDKPINDRMASTVRHNRARGRHSIGGMSAMVFAMLDNGMDDAAICNELGMEAEELLRLKHITGFSKLFANTEYNRAWVTKNQVQLRLAAEAAEAGK